MLTDKALNKNPSIFISKNSSFQKKDKNRLIEINRDKTSDLVNLCVEYNTELWYVSSTAAIGKNYKSATTEKDLWELTPRTTNY